MDKRSIGGVERRAFDSSLQIEKRDDGARTIRGHAAVFDRLSENLGGFREKIAPGAFDGILGDDVRGLFNHDANLILGRTAAGTMRIAVDGDGLTYEIDPPDTAFARDLMVSLDRGDVSQSSFGFTIDKDEWDEDEEGRVVRTITKIRTLYDVSPVTFPAYPDTDVAVREFEAYKADKAMEARRLEIEIERRNRILKIIELGV